MYTSDYHFGYKKCDVYAYAYTAKDLTITSIVRLNNVYMGTVEKTELF